MPIYEYKCNACGQVFELIQRFSDAPLTVHDNCGGVVERLLSAPALQFKGSGWYITDYARNGSDSAGKKNGSSANGAKSDSSSSNTTSSTSSTTTSTSDKK